MPVVIIVDLLIYLHIWVSASWDFPIHRHSCGLNCMLLKATDDFTLLEEEKKVGKSENFSV